MNIDVQRSGAACLPALAKCCFFLELMTNRFEFIHVWEAARLLRNGGREPGAEGGQKHSKLLGN